MKNYIMAGVNMSDESIVLAIALNRKELGARTFKNNAEGWEAMARHLETMARKASAQVHVAYEAGPHGMGFHDFLSERGIECFMLAPTLMKRSSKSRKQKTDAKDAEAILEILRGHLLAGNSLPEVWIPDVRLRDDREIVRGRLDIGQSVRRTRTQIQMLLKRWMVSKPKAVGKAWTLAHRAWLRGLTKATKTLGIGARIRLESLLRMLAALEDEQKVLEEQVGLLAADERYRSMAAAVDAETGVGLLTAMVFLTELGDPARFRNRRQIAAYFGLVPRSNETGQRDDCKGAITRQGSPRVRWALCQAYHSQARTDPKEKVRYEKLVLRNPKRKKVAVVAGMRRKAIRLWHVAMNAVKAEKPSPSSGPARRHRFSLPPTPSRYRRECSIDAPAVIET